MNRLFSLEWGRLTDAAPGICSFVSQDGINFENRKLVLAGEGNIDLVIVEFEDGIYRVYYWKFTDQSPVIRSLSDRKW